MEDTSLERGSAKKINHFLFMNSLKLCVNSEKETKRLTTPLESFGRKLLWSLCELLCKCALVAKKAGKHVSVGRMELSSGEVIPELKSDKGYKNLDISEANDITHSEMKDKIQNEYHRRVRQLTSKLNGGNTIRIINSRTVSLVRYIVGILKCTIDELKVMDKKTRKIMTINKMYHT